MAPSRIPQNLEQCGGKPCIRDMRIRVRDVLELYAAGLSSEQPWGVEAVPLREIGLRDSSDPEIFRRARAANAVVMTKDRDFIRLLDEQGPPPQVIWLRLGNSSNEALQQVLTTTLPQALELLRSGEPWVEIRPQANSGS